MSQKLCNIVKESAKHLEAGEPEPEMQPNLLTVYSMRYCPFAHRARLVLQHKQLKYQVVNVNLMKKPDWFLSKSPSGTVPVVREPDGWVLTESLLTADYLDEAYPQSPLYPKDAKKKAKIRYVVSKMGDVYIPAFYRWYTKTGDEQKAQFEPLLKAMEAMQDELGDSAFFGGCSSLQMADLMVWPWFERIRPSCKLHGFELPEARFPRLMAWMERMGRERAVQEIRTPDDIHVAFSKTALEKKPIYDGY